jgi:hypothetical protein
MTSNSELPKKKREREIMKMTDTFLSLIVALPGT